MNKIENYREWLDAEEAKAGRAITPSQESVMRFLYQLLGPVDVILYDKDKNVLASGSTTFGSNRASTNIIRTGQFYSAAIVVHGVEIPFSLTVSQDSLTEGDTMWINV